MGPDGEVSTVGLFYSHPEAQKIIDMLRANPDPTGYRYEIVEAVSMLSEKDRYPPGLKVGLDLTLNP